MKFELVEHTADIGLIAYGKTVEELFENASEGLFSILTDITKVRPLDEYKLAVSGEDLEDLFIRWLNELIYFWEVKRVLASRFSVNIDNNSLEGLIYGESFDHNRHTIEHGVKAVTYYDFRIEYDKLNEIWKAKVIIDV
ncbi:MAG TPA: archease [bacterium]|jgi:SHS2 domain-containing protein|nr:archease [Dictyoglomota bacterium]HHV81787.1 archease [bacterium]HOK29122.1 archease [bacterium]HOL54393.1 archease [bacterium]HON72958.1 archease [bacterium]